MPMKYLNKLESLRLEVVDDCLIDYDTEEVVLQFNIIDEPASEVRNAVQYAGELARILRDMLTNPDDTMTKLKASELLSVIVGYKDPEETT
jgi:hypothetical protein